MNKEDEYALDSDESDEDFCPDNVAGESDAASEVGTEDELDSDDDEMDERAFKNKTKKTKTRKSIGKQSDTEVTRRSTRQMEESGNACQAKANEKDELESDEEDKSRTDALWANFLGDVKPTDVKVIDKSKTRASSSNKEVAKADIAKSSSKRFLPAPPARRAPFAEPTARKITVAETVEFAGETLTLEKTIDAEDNIKENEQKGSPKVSVPKFPRTIGLSAAIKRTAPSGSGAGLGSILNQIGKKKKISVLEKSQLDWNRFKNDEGIGEQLQTFNKGKDGYLERQDFLERTDLRQFELEKNLRQTRRNI